MASVFVSSSLFGVWGLFFFFPPFLSKGVVQMGKEQVMQMLYLPSPWQRRAGRGAAGSPRASHPPCRTPGRAPRFVQRDRPPRPSLRAEIGVLSPLSGANCSAETLPGRVSSQVPRLPGTEGMNTQQQLRTKSSR